MEPPEHHELCSILTKCDSTDTDSAVALSSANGLVGTEFTFGYWL